MNIIDTIIIEILQIIILTKVIEYPARLPNILISEVAGASGIILHTKPQLVKVEDEEGHCDEEEDLLTQAVTQAVTAVTVIEEKEDLEAKLDRTLNLTQPSLTIDEVFGVNSERNGINEVPT